VLAAPLVARCRQCVHCLRRQRGTSKGTVSLGTQLAPGKFVLFRCRGAFLRALSKRYAFKHHVLLRGSPLYPPTAGIKSRRFSHHRSQNTQTPAD
jgi:hypothetical protein